jgi:hypothetical protein
VLDDFTMEKTKIVFIHHSTGANLIKQGNLRQLLRSANSEIEFWDHSYNLLPFWQITAQIIPYQTGLSDGGGNLTGTDYHLDITNTDPKGYADLFSQPLQSPPQNAFSKLISNFDVIAFKSCFPVTKIASDMQLEHYKKCYAIIRDRIDLFPEKLFILFTPPPLRREMTKKEFAHRASIFSQWMRSKEFLGKRKNIAVFDFFSLLAENTQEKSNFNMLKTEYAPLIPFDSHPNRSANVSAAKELAVFLIEKIKEFRRR